MTLPRVYIAMTEGVTCWVRSKISSLQLVAWIGYGRLKAAMCPHQDT